MMRAGQYDDYLGNDGYPRYRADDDDIDDSVSQYEPETPGYSVGFRGNSAVLNINIGTDVSTSSKDAILRMLKNMMGTVPIKIQLKDYSDVIRSAIGETREKLQDDYDVNVETDTEDHRGDDDGFSDVRSTASGLSSAKSSSAMRTRLVEFSKTSDLVIMYGWREVAEKIRNFAFSLQVTFSFTPKGYLLKGESEEVLNKVQDMIMKTYNSILPFKEFEGQSIEKINTACHALRNVKENLTKKYNLKFVYLMTSDAYYKSYQDLAKKVPDLAKKLAKGKSRRTNMRIILHQPNIRNKPDTLDKFRTNLLENSKPFVETFKIESSEPISAQELKSIITMASYEKLCATYEFKKIIDDKTMKILSAHQINLMSYYSNEFEKKGIQKKTIAMKEKIIAILRPPCFYHFTTGTERAIFFKFVLPEIEADLKEKRVYTSLVKKDNNNQQKKGQKPLPPSFALNIQGDKQNTKWVQQKIGKLMQTVKSTAYVVKIDGPLGYHILKSLAQPESDHFFNHHFNEIYSVCPETKLRKNILRKPIPNQNPNQNNKYPNNKPQQGNNQGPNQTPNPHQQQKQYQQPQQQYQEELVVEILYKNKEDYDQIKDILDKLFKNVVSKLIFIHSKLSDLLLKNGTNIEDFKTQNAVIVSEFFDQKIKKPKTALIGEKESVENAAAFVENLNSASVPINERIQIDNQLILNALKLETKNLSPPGVSWKFFKYFITLLGESAKVATTKQNIEKFKAKKKNEIIKDIIDEMPGSHLKILEANRKFYYGVQFQNNVKIDLIRPTSSKIDMKIGVQNQNGSKSLVLVHGDITKLQVDAIVNSTNLKFGDATIIQGVAKAIMDKAGEEYVEECQTHGELAETKVFTTGAGKLESCKSIINVCPPIYKSDSDLTLGLRKLKESIQNVLREASFSGFNSIAIPFLSAGNYGIPPQEAIICIVEELASGLFGLVTTLERIMICEVDENKMKIAEQKIRSLIPNEKVNEYVVKNQWQWLDDGNVWTNYDLEVNRKIDYAHSQNQQKVDIKFPATRAVGSHIISIKQKVLVRKSTGKRSRIERKPDGWYEDDQKMMDEISEIIDLKQQQGHDTFEIFLTEYTIDLVALTQVNKQTYFVRRIQKMPVVSNQVARKFTIPNVALMHQSSLRQGKVYGQLIIQGFTNENVQRTKKEILNSLESLNTQAEIEISPKLGEDIIEFIENEIKRHKIKIQEGQVKAGRKIKVLGLKPVITKLQSHVWTANQAAGQAQSLPKSWAKMDENNFSLVPLGPQDQEWIEVSQRFVKTMSSQIKAVHRLQNAKFWRDYCAEKENLGRIHERAGFSSKINEEMLWHGTSGYHPENIYAGMEECFDMQYANDGMWGRGLYFAVNAKYSDGYAHPTQAGTKLFMLCRVLIGDAIELENNRAYRKPPERSDGKEKIHYDSIKGNTQGSDIYILYRMRRAYPEYLIEY